MQLSTRGRYGLRAMVQLAQGFEKGPQQLRTIAKDQAISEKYLHALLAILKRSGLVRSLRGRDGGYILTRPPSEIRVNEVIRVLEGSMALVGCVEDKNFCGRVAYCPAHQVWASLSKTVDFALAGFSLKDIAGGITDKEATPMTFQI